MQQEMMRIYREEKSIRWGVACPSWSRCRSHRPVLGAAEQRGDAQRAWIGWITDLSAKDRGSSCRC